MLTVERFASAACALGVVGLLASGVWYLNDRRVAHGEESDDRQLAERVRGMLATGTPRAEIEKRLLDDGLAPSVVEAALELEWPHGQVCPKCGADVRGFEFLLRHLRQSWYHCPNCSWVGQVESTVRAS
jgi:rubredoxin